MNHGATASSPLDIEESGFEVSVTSRLSLRSCVFVWLAGSVLGYALIYEAFTTTGQILLNF
jgi:hypothetical protein